jgi:hypothetical protein
LYAVLCVDEVIHPGCGHIDIWIVELRIFLKLRGLEGSYTSALVIDYCPVFHIYMVYNPADNFRTW